MDEDDWFALAGELQRNLFGPPFGALIMIGHLRFGAMGQFVGGHNDTEMFLRQTDAADRAGINDARTTCRGRRSKHIASAFDVCGIHRGIIAEPEVIAASYVKAPIAP